MQYLCAVSKMTNDLNLFQRQTTKSMPQPLIPKKLKLKSSMKAWYLESLASLALEYKNEAGQRLTKFCQENTLVIANTLYQEHKRRLYMWTSPDGQYWKQIDYIVCSQRWRSSIQSVKTRPGADFGCDHELLHCENQAETEESRKNQ